MSDVFSRNILFWGQAAQDRLQACAVLVAGVGGLGCQVAELLVRSGVGELLLVDNGVVDETDLNRQSLYTLHDIGERKVDVAARRLQSLTGRTRIQVLPIRVSSDAPCAAALADHTFDGIADCLDNFPSRFALEKYLPPGAFMVHGGVQHDFGQVTTLCNGRTPSLMDIYGPQPAESEPIPVCPTAVAGIASIMAHEVLGNILDRPQLVGTMLILEFSDLSVFRQRLTRV
jgi:molybdopterin/thiamine biosynthesis adenylyltransferase